MGKKPMLSPRRPPTPDEMARRAQFVAGEVENREGERLEVKTSRRSRAQAPERSGDQTSERSKAVQSRADGREVRRHTIYLPVPLAKTLAHYCVEHDKDLSSVVAEAVSQLVERTS